MKKIELKALHLENFKGIRNLKMDFTQHTDIYGANATGKTTLFDAFLWLLFGKDSMDRKDFEIKTLDAQNRVIEKIDHTVEGHLSVNDEPLLLKRVLREKWVKQKAALEPTFVGNETLYYWNEVPMNQREYNTKINEILDESIFKLISNPMAFNSLKWQDRRNVLVAIAGELNDAELVKGDKDLEDLLQLNEKKSIQELKSETTAKVKKIKVDLQLIPTRIDEVQKSKPTPMNDIGLRETLAKEEVALGIIESQIKDSSKAYQSKLDERQTTQRELFDLESKLEGEKRKLQSQAEKECQQDDTSIVELEHKIQTTSSTLETYQNGIKSLEAHKNTLQTELTDIEQRCTVMRNYWHDENAKQLIFDDDNFICTCCKRPFETDDIESKKAELQNNFNANKANTLASVNKQGLALKEQLEANKSELNATIKRIEQGKGHIEKSTKELQNYQTALQLEKAKVTAVKDVTQVYLQLILDNPNIPIFEAKIEELKTITQMEIVVDNQELEMLKKEKQSVIDQIKQELTVQGIIRKADERIQELHEEEKSLSNALNQLEKLQYTIDRFIKLKIEGLEKGINRRFEYVSFKLFETQINGGEVETCQTLIEGVPFSDANKASRVNAGMDIINVLSNYYKTTAPIFIDNRESVTELIPTHSQVINLFVSPEYKTLHLKCK